jgi:hypothetical protein
MFQEYEVVQLKRDIRSEGLSAGVRGTVLLIYDDPTLPLAYEVEFADDEGTTLAVLTVTDEDIESIELR